MRDTRHTYRGVVIVIAAFTLFGAACNKTDTDQAKAKAVVKEFLNDAADGRGTQACAALTGDAVRFVSVVGAVAQSDASCPDAVKTLSGQFSADEKKALKSATIKGVSVSGAQATIARNDIELKYQGESHLFPRPSNSPVVLVKTDAGWKIQSLG